MASAPRPPAGAAAAEEPAGDGPGRSLALGPARVRWTSRAEGDARGGPGRPGTEGLDLSALSVPAGRPVTWPRQVHGDRVVVVDRPGAGRGEEADGLVSAHPGVALAVMTADCAPVALASEEGVVGAAHAGWAGLLAGVIEATVGAMRDLGASGVVAALGPCIHAECYEFGPAALDLVARRLGDEVRSATAGGRPALDVPAAVRAALAREGAVLVHDEDACTACAVDGPPPRETGPGSPPYRYFSHRARRDQGRQAMVVWTP